jgi:hypothetical protein
MMDGMTDDQIKAILIHLRIAIAILAAIAGILLALAWEYL